MLLVVFVEHANVDPVHHWLRTVGAACQIPSPEMATVSKSPSGHVVVEMDGADGSPFGGFLPVDRETLALVMPPGVETPAAAVAGFGDRLRTASAGGMSQRSLRDAGDALAEGMAAIIVRFDGLDIRAEGGPGANGVTSAA